MMYFHPKDTRETGLQRKDIENFALWFTHFLPLQKGKKTKEYKFELSDDDHPELSSNTKELLRALQQRQQMRFAALQAQYPAFRLLRGIVDWRMVIGLGGAHVLETSMTLHHVYGIPYIPGSAVKGMTRHYFLSEVLAPEFPEEELDLLDAVFSTIDDDTLRETTDTGTLRKRCEVKRGKKKFYPGDTTVEKAKNERTLLKLGQIVFGTQRRRGLIIFGDALPEGEVQFQKDLMNPHYPEYYKENSQVPPNDCQNPIPIPFLTIEKAAFTFPLIVKPLCTTDTDPATLLKTVAQWLQSALEDQGIGAKSAVGYGYFTDVKDLAGSLQEEIEQAEQQAAKEAERKRSASLSPVDRLCEELAILQNEHRSYDIYNNELPKFDGDEERRLARALKDYWQSINKWKKCGKKQKEKVRHIKDILGE